MPKRIAWCLLSVLPIGGAGAEPPPAFSRAAVTAQPATPPDRAGPPQYSLSPAPGVPSAAPAPPVPLLRAVTVAADPLPVPRAALAVRPPPAVPPAPKPAAPAPVPSAPAPAAIATGIVEIRPLPTPPDPPPVSLSVEVAGPPAARPAPAAKRGAGGTRPAAVKQARPPGAAQKPRRLCWKDGRLDVCP